MSLAKNVEKKAALPVEVLYNSATYFSNFVFSESSKGVSLASDQEIVSAAIETLELLSDIATVPKGSFYLTECVILDSLYAISLLMRMCGNAAKCEFALRNVIRMSRSMNVKGMELRATADLVALLGPTTALKEPNKKLILDFGKLMKNLSLSGRDT